LILEHLHAALGERLLSSGCQVNLSLLSRGFLDLLDHAHLHLDDGGEDLHVLVIGHGASDIRRTINCANLITDLLDEDKIFRGQLHLLLLLLHDLLAFSEMGVFDGFEVFVVLEVVLYHGGHELVKFDSVLHVNCVHNFSALKHDDLLGLLLGRSTHVLELLLAVELKLDLLNDDCLEHLLGEREVAFLLTERPNLLLVLLELLGVHGDSLRLFERGFEVGGVEVHELSSEFRDFEGRLLVLLGSLSDAISVLLHLAFLEELDALLQELLLGLHKAVV